MEPVSELHSAPAHLLHTTSTAMSLGGSSHYNVLAHSGDIMMPHHSPHMLPDLWPLDAASSSGHDSSSSSPSSGNETQTVKYTTSATASSNSSRKRSSTPVGTPDDRAEKRRRNNLAAAKYRQKKVDRIEDLEGQLQAMTAERDELKIALAKRDAEVELLRRLLESKR